MPGYANKLISWNGAFFPTVIIAMAMGMALVSLPLAGAGAEYVVEVIVFENKSPSDGGEHWRSASGKPSLQGAIDLENNRVGITALGPDQSTLANTLNALNSSGHFRVLTHKIWKQPGYSRKTAKAVRVNSAAGRLDGTVRLERGHYLNLFIDIAYYPRSGIGTASALRLKQQRRIRKEEVQYFDHPRYGVLTVVRSMGSGR